MFTSNSSPISTAVSNFTVIWPGFIMFMKLNSLNLSFRAGIFLCHALDYNLLINKADNNR